MEQQLRFCRTTDGTTIAYASVGQGPPLVKAANWLGHLEFEWQSPVWRHWLSSLAQDYQLIRYDERGCGLSDWNVDDFSLQAWVDDLDAVVTTIGLDRFPLLGISRGGPIAIAYAERYPEKVSQLILYGSFVRGWQNRELSPAKREELEILVNLIRLGWGKSNPAFRQVFTSLFMPEATAEQMHWFNDLQRMSTSPENAVKMRQASGQLDVRELASHVHVPTLVLHGRGDAVVPFAEGRLLATLIPGARFVSLESINHILLEDEPAWPHFLKEVFEFLGSPVPATSHRTTSPKKLLGRQGRHSTGSSILTLREREVLELIARGYRNDEIAHELVLSPKTIRNYISIILGKLEVGSRGEAIVRAREMGFGRENEGPIQSQ